MKAPALHSQLIALLMPTTMTVLIPYWVLSNYDHSSRGLQLTGILVFLVGFSLLATTLWQFINIGKGTLAPWNATKHFIATGPYRYCRNPMISGVLFMIIGEGLFFGSKELFIWAATFFVANTTYFILKEEPDLERKFGKEYTSYKQKVNRWLPTSRHLSP
jgi:protein-S-isoprenylcysteine O-methyltransferase Ste14